MIRSLGRRGVHVVAADATPRSAGFSSRYAAERVLYPPPTIDGHATVAALARAASERRIDLVVPVGEGSMVVVAEARDRFPDGTVVALPAPDALDVARDKRATVELAERLGVPTPRTIDVRSATEAVRESADLRWPVALKPQMSRSVRERGQLDAFGVEYAADRAALEARMRAYEGRCPVLLQEYARGEGHGVGLLMDRGKPLLAFQHRRLREVPFTGGPSSLRESVPLDPVLFDYSVRLLEALAWTGPAMVEFKVAPEGASLMEINGRLWGSLPLAVKSGVDFPGRMVDLFLSPRPEPSRAHDFGYSVGVRSRDLKLELSWIASVLARRAVYPFLDVPDRREALAAALRLFDPRDGFDILAVRDPLPGVSELAEIAARTSRHLLSRVKQLSFPAPPGAEARAQSR